MDVDESNDDRAPCTLTLKKEFYQHNPTYIVGPGSLLAHDVLRLIEPRQMLNDNIINLGLQFCQSDLSLRCPSMHNEFFFFDTFFHTKLRAAGNETVAKIFKKCPLNEKKFVFMPIHLMEAVHWLLCLLYLHRPNLGGAVQSVHLFLLDSLRSGTRGDLAKRLEWCIRRVAVHQKLQLPVQFVVQWIKVPQQNNLVDCGLYLLHFVQRILDNPMEFISAFMDGDTNCVWDEDKIPGTRERLIRRVSELVDEFSKKVIEVDDEEGVEFELIEGPLIHSRITTQTAGADRAASPMEVDGPGQIGERTPLAVPEALAEHEMEIDSDAGPSVQPDARSTTNAATSASLSIPMHVELPRRLPQRGSPLQNVESGPYLCSPCRSVVEHRARQVAAIVPELDRATIEDLQGRLEDGNDWQLADETNVPECWGRHESQSSDRCNVSERYLRHLKAAELGLGSDEEYTNHERYLDEIENPRMILGDLEPRAVTRPPHDAGLVQHMRALRLLQGARGRLVMNDFLHEDPAAQQRLKGVCAGLDGTIGAKVTQRDKQQLELEESKRVLEKLRRGVIEGRQQLQQVEDERRVTTDSLRPGEQNPIIPDSQFTSIPHPASGGPLSGSGSALAQTDFTEKGLAKLSAGDLEKLRMYLRGMKLPRCEVAAEMFARWVQVHRDTAIKGVPVSKQSLIVDLRDVRGRNRIMPLVPSKERKRQQHQLCLLCLLGVLAVPYAYARLLQKAGIQVAGARSTNPAAWTQSATDDEVVRFLANQGLTIAEADDSWQFARNYVQAMVHEGAARTGGGRPEDVQYAGLLARVEAEVKVHGMPPGLRREADDRLVCFRGLMGYQEGVVPVFDFTEKLSALGVGSPPSQPVPKPPSPRVASPPPARLPQGPSRNGETVEREDRKYQGRAGRSYEPRAYEAQDGHRTGGVVGRGRGHNSYGAGPSRRGRERDHGHYYTAPSNSARSWRRSRSPSDQRGK